MSQKFHKVNSMDTKSFQIHVEKKYTLHLLISFYLFQQKMVLYLVHVIIFVYLIDYYFSRKYFSYFSTIFFLKKILNSKIYIFFFKETLFSNKIYSLPVACSSSWCSSLLGFSFSYRALRSRMTTWFRMWENSANRKAMAAVTCLEPTNFKLMKYLPLRQQNSQYHFNFNENHQLFVKINTKILSLMKSGVYVYCSKILIYVIVEEVKLISQNIHDFHITLPLKNFSNH